MSSSVLAISGCDTLRPLGIYSGPSHILYMTLNTITNVQSNPDNATPRLYNALLVNQTF